MSKKSTSDEQRADQNSTLKNPLRTFFIGLILLCVGLFWFSQKVIVQTSWFNWYLGGIHISGGLTVVPLIIGIVMKFFNPKSKIATIIIILGGLFILASIIMSINFRFISTSLYEFILIIGFIAAGSGMVLRTMLSDK